MLTRFHRPGLYSDEARRSRALIALIALALATACSARTPRYRAGAYGYAPGATYAGNGGYRAAPGYRGGYAAQGGTDYVRPASAAGGGANDLLPTVDRGLRAQGYQPAAQIMQQAIPERGLVSFSIATRPGTCYAVFALGDAGARDVDLQVIAPSGAVVGEDRNVDTHPAVAFCAFQPGLHLARVNMFQGAGNVLFGVYQGPPGSTADLAAVFGGAAAAPAAPTTPDPATAARIAAFRQQMAAQGYQALRDPAAVVMQRGQTLNWPARLPVGACYSFATFGGPGVRDSDIFVFDQAGRRQLAADAGTAVDAVVRDFCPPATGAYQLRPRLYAGDGLVWFLALTRSQSGGGAVAVDPTTAQNGGTQGATISTAGARAGGIDVAFQRAARELQSVGYAPVGAAVPGQLTRGQELPQSVTLQQGSCYAITAVGDSTVQDLGLHLTDASNQEVDRDYSQDASPIVRVCPAATGMFTLRVQMDAGEGAIRLGLFRWEGGTSGAGMTGLLFVRNAEVTRVLQADGYQGDADFELVRGRIQEGRSTTRNVALRSGQCYAFVAVGGTGVNALNMTVQRGHRTVAEDTAPGAFPAARYCATDNGAHSVSVRSAHGSGEFVFRVFRRQSADAAGG